MYIHVFPPNDIRQHALTAECWCQPIEDDGVLIHNSLDDTEKYESGERKPN